MRSIRASGRAVGIRRRACLGLVGLLGLAAAPTHAQQDSPLNFGVGLYQPDKEKNDATYRPLAEHLSKALGRPIKLYTVDSWEGLAKSLAAGETDIALMGPWGYVLANHVADAQAVASILYDGKPEYHAIMITHPNSGIKSIADLKGKTFAFGDKGSTSGYLIPFHHFQKKRHRPRAVPRQAALHQASGDRDAGHTRRA